jgi:exoribonuclease R
VPRPTLTLAHDDGAALRSGFAQIRRDLDVVEQHSPAVQRDARAAVTGTDPYAAERTDLRDVAFVTIDPTGSTDLDQAVHLERRPGGYRVRYAIADVAAFVRPGTALDADVHHRGETVYCPDTRVPLHPAVLSEDAASLLDGVDRPAVAWTFDLDHDGDLTGTDVRRALVRSRARLDYAAVQLRADEDTGAGRGQDELPRLLVEIGVLRAQQEHARGGVSLGRPEQEVVADGTGWRLAFRAPLPVEDHNAQISLLTGMAAARIMLDAGLGVLRTMPSADEAALHRLRLQARALGVAWPAGTGYAEVLDALDPASPATAAFLAAATSLFRGAAWTPFDGAPPAQPWHGALAAPYAHVTAPLRRLVDRYGLEVCLAAHAGRDAPAWVRESLPALGEEMGRAARRTAAVDRACTDLVEATVLAPHVGEDFAGVALDAGTVQIHEPAVLARCDGPPLPAGDAVQVRLVRADPTTREVRFSLADPPRT